MRHTPLGRIRAGAPVLPRDGIPRRCHGLSTACPVGAYPCGGAGSPRDGFPHGTVSHAGWYPTGRFPTRDGFPRGMVSHGVAMGCQRHAPLGRIHVATPVPRGTVSHAGRFPTALPWAVNGMPRWGVSVWRRRFHAGRFPTRDGFPRRCHGLSTACPVGASGSGRTEGAFHSPAHGNAVGNPSPKIPSPVRASQAPPLGPKVRLFVHNTMPL